MIRNADMETLAKRLQPYFRRLAKAISDIRSELEQHADGKKLKGDEITGWLGEVYGKLLLGGSLVDDSFEHDFETGKLKVSVKARKGWQSGWKQSSAIPIIDGAHSPTHLMFIHLDDDYSVHTIWMYPWGQMVAADRLKEQRTRGGRRSFVFRVTPTKDSQYVVYSAEETNS